MTPPTLVTLLREDGTTLGVGELPADAPPRPMIVSDAGRVFRFVRADPPQVPAKPGDRDSLVYQETPSVCVINFSPAEGT